MSAGYSRTPLLKKLGIAPGDKVAFVDAPEHYADLLGELPEGVRICAVDEDWSGLKFVYRREDR